MNTSAALAPSLRLEQGFEQGAQIGMFYDPMIAKLVVHGRDRTEALRKLRTALEEYKVVGVSTNIEFLRTLAGHDAFIRAEVETGFIPKYFDELFPPIPDPSPEALAQAALFVVLREHPGPTSPSPWSTLTLRRFGGDAYERTITLQTDDAHATPTTVHVRALANGHFDITTPQRAFTDVAAHLASPTTLSVALDGALMRTTIVSQKPPALVPASASPNTMERLHVFEGARKTTLVLPPPDWLLSLGGDVRGAAKGALRAPMPSVVVEVRVQVGDRVEAGQPVVVLESMKTETVLRAPVAGVVRAVGCAKGEMVEEGRELVDVEEDSA